MKVKIKVEKEFDIKTLEVSAHVRHWENSDINGSPDTENGDLVPCKNGENWCPIIDIETGIITNWEQGKLAEIHYLVCDRCSWKLKDSEGNIVLEVNGEYVPDTLCPQDDGYGDYIKMHINDDGLIHKWEFDINDFTDE